MKDAAAAADVAAAGMVANPGMLEALLAPAARFDFECVGADGQVKWRDGFDNLVTTAGKTFIVDTLLKGSAYTAAWYLILAGAGTKAAADTMSSHAAWTDEVPYAAGSRPAITWGTTTTGSNTCTAVSISINATATIAGAGITTSSTKGGTTGTLYNIGDFSASRGVASGDTLNVTITIAVT